MKIKDLMTHDVRSCSSQSKLSDVAKIMAEVNCGAVPVVDGGKLVGIVTDRDIVLRAVAKGKDINATPCSEVMTNDAFTASPDMEAQDAADMMAQHQIRRLPVLDGDTLVGIVALGDLATEDIHINEAGQALSNISEPSRPTAH